jgi:hypothetical protein
VNVLDLQQQFIDGLASLETGALSDKELSEAAVGLLRGGRQIAAQVARVTAAYDRRREIKCDAHNWWKTNHKHPTSRGGKHNTTGNGREPPPDDG